MSQKKNLLVPKCAISCWIVGKAEEVCMSDGENNYRVL
jgi:hypothetical protein